MSDETNILVQGKACVLTSHECSKCLGMPELEA
jgi:hypothetical protein